MSTTPEDRLVVVTGDRVVDYDLYEGDRMHPALLDRPGVRVVCRHGGPANVCKLLSALAARAETPRVTVRLGGADDADGSEAADVQRAFATWRPYPRSASDRSPVWRASLLGYGSDHPAAGLPPLRGVDPLIPNEPRAIDVLVLDDAGRGFRMAARKPSWLLSDDGPAPGWIVLKTADPVARGDLWNELAARHADRLVCVVSADDLRRGQATISRGLSWERTVDDILSALRSDPTLAALAAARHLVVTLSRDGALWIDRAKDEAYRATLLFDPAGAEGAWDASRQGRLTGYLSVMVASIAYALARAPGPSGWDEEGFAVAVERGLQGMRDLSENGHGPVAPPTDAAAAPDGFPTARVAAAVAERARPAFARLRIPWIRPDGTEPWMALEAAQVPPGASIKASLLGPARLIVTHGPEHVLKDYPHAVFRKLTVVDRREIEALRGIRQLMLGYRDGGRISKPLSIGVFGPPGAGKSFGVRQLSDEVFGERAWVEFNLSQFAHGSDLMGPFHQVRDMVLAGITPVVFWDEFDSQENKWLQFLLAPMQDGRFQDGPLNHAIGKCVFVFAGGTSATFAAYPPRSDEGRKAFRLRKGPDFVSRLDAFYDVVGPNRRGLPGDRPEGAKPEPDPSDVSYPVRRALLIRGILAAGRTDRLEIDTDLLNALLLTDRYRHGSRSLEKLVAALKDHEDGAVRRSSVPSPERLAMHVDARDFSQLLNRNGAYRIGTAIEEQATKIHAAYREHVGRTGEPVDERLDMAYAALAPAEKEDNRAAARRTVDVLGLMGMGVAAAGDGTPVRVADYEALVDHHIERLAEAEHDGWMRHRLLNGWSHGTTRDFHLRKHPSLKPYVELPESERAKDRLMVRGYAKRIHEAGFRIVWLVPPPA